MRSCGETSDVYLKALDDTLLEQFKQYSGREGQAFARERDFLSSAAGRSGKLSFDEFGQQVSQALWSGDTHAIPEVDTAAKLLRARIFDPVLKLAQDTKDASGRALIADEIGPPKGDASFFPRLFDKKAIEANPNGFDDRVTAWLANEQAEKAATQSRISLLRDNLDAATAAGRDDVAADIRAELEQQVVSWEGASSKEAKTAILARMRAEAQRELDAVAKDKVGATGRLTAADRAVDNAVNRILASSQDLSEQELRARAAEIRNRIDVGPDGRLPYDVASGASEKFTGIPNPVRGSLNRRDFAIPTDLIKDFVHQDPQHAVASYLRTALPDIYMTRKFGDVEATGRFKEVNEHYDALKAASKSPKEAEKIEAQRKAEIRDLAGVRDRVRGVYGMPTTDFQRNAARVAAGVANYNVMTYLNTSVLNRLQDMGNATWRRGLLGYFGDGFVPYVQALAGNKASRAELEAIKDMGIGIDTQLGHLVTMFGEVTHNYLPGNKFERGLRVGAKQAMFWSGHGPWTDMNKQIASMAAMSDFLRTAKSIAEGTASPRDMERMTNAGISPAMAVRINKAFENGGHQVVAGRKIANTADWTDQVPGRRSRPRSGATPTSPSSRPGRSARCGSRTRSSASSASSSRSASPRRSASCSRTSRTWIRARFRASSTWRPSARRATAPTAWRPGNPCPSARRIG